MNTHFCKVGTIRPNTSKSSLKKSIEKIGNAMKKTKKTDISK